jgi:hypothetical protein
MSRQRLPNRRPNQTIEFSRDGINYRMTIGFVESGKVGEVFINADRANSMLDAFVSDAAILTSLCLQCGIGLEEIRHALRRDVHGVAASPIGVALDRIGTLQLVDVE